MKPYQAQWNYLQSAWKQGRHPQSMLFVGPLDKKLSEFIQEFTQFVFCTSSEKKPCYQCADCCMTGFSEHPDVDLIKPDKLGGAIKIDQIRELQHYSYLTPQRAKYRLIIIESADRMNMAAANALLKILEEPAEHTLFLLVAHQLSTVLPTVLSRCQVVRFTVATDFSTLNLLILAENYQQDSEYLVVVRQAESILDGLIAVIEKREHPCFLAAQWAQFELNILLWFFYLVYAQVQILYINKSVITGPAMNQINKLVSLLSPAVIFAQIDKINSIQRKLSHNMNVNQTLILEDLLFDL